MRFRHPQAMNLFSVSRSYKQKGVVLDIDCRFLLLTLLLLLLLSDGSFIPSSVPSFLPSLVHSFVRSPPFDTLVAYYGWERIGEIMEQSEQQDLEDGKCSVTPAKWVLVGHSLGTLAIEKVPTRKGCRSHLSFRPQQPCTHLLSLNTRK